MPDLTAAQYELVYAMLSLTIASMGASAAFFLIGRSQVGEKYRPALLVSGLVVGIACYHYVRIFLSWQEAYTLVDGAYAASGIPFLDSYRYADWLLTVPLLLVELVAVLALEKRRAKSLFLRLSAAAVLMIAAGYPGEIADDTTTKHIWGWVSTAPFLYIMYVLFRELGSVMEGQPRDLQKLLMNTRYLLIATWGVYPTAYALSIFGVGGSAAAEVGLQVGYSIADITAKAGFGLMIYAIARAKTAHDAAALRTPVVEPPAQTTALAT